jgi:tetratricopeptide (TPR) repeat protein
MRPVLVLALVLVIGCSSPPTKPETPAERDARIEKAIAKNPNGDPWPYYERGQIEEERGDLDRAVEDYGTAVSILPPRKVTRPALALGRVHWKLKHAAPARRVLEEVVTTIPSDPKLYVENPDFREAALILKEIYAQEKDVRASEKLRARFLDEFGGKPSDWPEGT